MTILQAIILGLLQGLTELFPVSSLGHSILIPHLLGWGFDVRSNTFLIFLVMTHLATSLVLFAFYWKEWKLILEGLVRSLIHREVRGDDEYAKLGWLLIVATIPVGILGILFEDSFKTIFGTPTVVAIFLMVNGILLWVIEIYKKRSPIGRERPSLFRISRLSWWQGIKVGLSECLALFPGFSRTGTTLGGGLLAGLDHESATRFSFLLATPVIFAAAILKVPELFLSANQGMVPAALLGTLASAAAAYLSVRFLSKYFKSKTMIPFGIYCIVLGAICIIVFAH